MKRRAERVRRPAAMRHVGRSSNGSSPPRAPASCERRAPSHCSTSGTVGRREASGVRQRRIRSRNTEELAPLCSAGGGRAASASFLAGSRLSTPSLSSPATPKRSRR